MAGSVRRGFSPDDEINFTGDPLETLKRASADVYLLLSRGYPIKSTSTFVGNHYLLSERQRMAMTRAVASAGDIALRKAKCGNPSDFAEEEVNIDGFNQIITLEVALSGSPVFKCMDGTFRDLAGLRGTYKLIDKTDTAIRLILAELRRLKIRRAEFWLDAPVSNSGRLKARIADLAEEIRFDVGIQVVDNVDKVLYNLNNVITGDSIILDKCTGWLNLNDGIIPGIPDVWLVELMTE